jgi:sec-independent protein translocase protein TatB
MFDLSWGEFVLIGIVALIAIGPKELPGVLRGLGQWIARIRGMASEFQGQFQEAMREAEMHDLKKQVDQLSDAARGLSSYNPLEDDDYDGPAPKKETPPPAADASAEATPMPPATLDAPAAEPGAPEPPNPEQERRS